MIVTQVTRFPHPSSACCLVPSVSCGNGSQSYGSTHRCSSWRTYSASMARPRLEGSSYYSHWRPSWSNSRGNLGYSHKVDLLWTAGKWHALSKHVAPLAPCWKARVCNFFSSARARSRWTASFSPWIFRRSLTMEVSTCLWGRSVDIVRTRYRRALTNYNLA